MQDIEQRRMAHLEGGLAQLGEHLLCKQGVVGSIPSSSTNYFDARNQKQILSGRMHRICFWLF
jgi:hypothetical protein